MEKKDKKIINAFIIILLVCMTIILFTTQVQAAFNPDDWKPNSTTNVTGAIKFQGFANRIIGGVQVVGSISSVVALIILGIKYMLGSVEERAEYKKTMKPYLIGAIMVFGITNILVVIQNVIGAF